MKTLVLVLLVLAALVLGSNYLQTGKIGFNVSLSEEERELRALDEQLEDAMRGYRISGRAVAVGGMAPSSGAENAVGEVRRISGDLARLGERTKDPAVREKVRDLERRVRAAKAELGIP